MIVRTIVPTVSLGALLAACAAPYSPPPVPAGHPASPATLETPHPAPSQTLQPRDLAPPPEGQGSGHHHPAAHGEKR